MYWKYPKTPHLPWSPGATNDDTTLIDCKNFVGKRVIVTEKRDGECTTMNSDGYIHARSINGTGKPYQSWLIQKWRELCYCEEIPKSMRFVGENLFAKHSIEYTELKSYFEVFAVFQYLTENDFPREESNVFPHHYCMDWDSVVDWCKILDIKQEWLIPVPVLYDGIWDQKQLENLIDSLDLSLQEGVVVRNADSFLFEDFSSNVAKWVRKDHITTNEHWTKNWTPNKLKDLK